MSKDTVIYTAISGNYDDLKDPNYIDENCDYICFTDNPKIKSNIWNVRPFPKNTLDSVRKCRNLKILPHRYLKEYKYSIWMDGNIEINGKLDPLISRYFRELSKELLTFKHPSRDCIYDEAEACITMKTDNAKTISKQIEKYYNEGFPKKNGLVESNVIFREHNSPKVIQVMEDWWKEVESYSRRDQLSFNYVAWKHGFKYDELDGNSRGNNDYFNAIQHKKNPLKKIKRLLNIY